MTVSADGMKRMSRTKQPSHWGQLGEERTMGAYAARLSGEENEDQGIEDAAGSPIYCTIVSG
jgi:hypothetical protein